MRKFIDIVESPQQRLWYRAESEATFGPDLPLPPPTNPFMNSFRNEWGYCAEFEDCLQPNIRFQSEWELRPRKTFAVESEFITVKELLDAGMPETLVQQLLQDRNCEWRIEGDGYKYRHEMHDAYVEELGEDFLQGVYGIAEWVLFNKLAFAWLRQNNYDSVFFHIAADETGKMVMLDPTRCRFVRMVEMSLGGKERVVTPPSSTEPGVLFESDKPMKLYGTGRTTDEIKSLYWYSGDRGFIERLQRYMGYDLILELDSYFANPLEMPEIVDAEWLAANLGMSHSDIAGETWGRDAINGEATSNEICHDLVKQRAVIAGHDAIVTKLPIANDLVEVVFPLDKTRLRVAGRVSPVANKATAKPGPLFESARPMRFTLYTATNDPSKVFDAPWFATSRQFETNLMSHTLRRYLFELEGNFDRVLELPAWVSSQWMMDVLGMAAAEARDVLNARGTGILINRGISDEHFLMMIQNQSELRGHVIRAGVDAVISRITDYDDTNPYVVMALDKTRLRVVAQLHPRVKKQKPTPGALFETVETLTGYKMSPEGQLKLNFNDPLGVSFETDPMEIYEQTDARGYVHVYEIRLVNPLDIQQYGTFIPTEVLLNLGMPEHVFRDQMLFSYRNAQKQVIRPTPGEHVDWAGTMLSVNSEIVHGVAVQEWLRRAGYDGIIHTGLVLGDSPEVIVFDGTRVRQIECYAPSEVKLPPQSAPRGPLFENVSRTYTCYAVSLSGKLKLNFSDQWGVILDTNEDRVVDGREPGQYLHVFEVRPENPLDLTQYGEYIPARVILDAGVPESIIRDSYGFFHGGARMKRGSRMAPTEPMDWDDVLLSGESTVTGDIGVVTRLRQCGYDAIVWSPGGGDPEIILFDGTRIRQIAVRPRFQVGTRDEPGTPDHGPLFEAADFTIPEHIYCCSSSPIDRTEPVSNLMFVVGKNEARNFASECAMANINEFRSSVRRYAVLWGRDSHAIFLDEFQALLGATDADIAELASSAIVAINSVTHSGLWKPDEPLRDGYVTGGDLLWHDTTLRLARQQNYEALVGKDDFNAYTMIRVIDPSKVRWTKAIWSTRPDDVPEKPQPNPGPLF